MNVCSSNNMQPDNLLPLIVDLDGTLSRSDTLHEALLRRLTHKPAALFGLIAALRAGKVDFKAHLADQQIVSTDSLPLNQSVMALIE